MPFDLIAHGVILTAGAKALPVALAKAGGTAHGLLATKTGVFAATKAKVGGCSAFSTKSQIAKDVKKLEEDIESMDKELLMMPFALASPMTLFSNNEEKMKAENPRKVRRTRKTERCAAYGNFL